MTWWTGQRWRRDAGMTAGGGQEENDVVDRATMVGGQEENDVVDRGTMVGGRGNDGGGWERCGGLPGMGVGGAHPSPD